MNKLLTITSLLISLTSFGQIIDCKCQSMQNQKPKNEQMKKHNSKKVDVKYGEMKYMYNYTTYIVGVKDEKEPIETFGYNNMAIGYKTINASKMFYQFDLNDSSGKAAYKKRVDSLQKVREIEKTTFKYKAKEFYRKYKIELLSLLDTMIFLSICFMWGFIIYKMKTASRD